MANNFAADSGSANFQANILDNYDVVTYHWKLFIVSNEVTSSGIVSNLSDQVIIAESGVSDLTIDKVELEFLPTPSLESGTGVLTTAKFEIVEPAGAGLIDKLFYESINLGIGNWQIMPVYLQLEFRGRSPETSESEDTIPGPVGNLYWLWPLKISNATANVTTVGTRYEFSAMFYNELTQANMISSLKYDIIIPELTNFGEAMKVVMEKYNTDQKYSGIISEFDKYKVVIEPKIAEYKITQDDNITNSVRHNSYSKFDKKSAKFLVGTSIDKIVDSLLSHTDEYQKLMSQAEVPGANGLPMQQEKSQMKNFWRIITEARPLVFDPKRYNYSHEFTTYIIEYKLGILDQNPTQTASPPTTNDASKKRLMEYISTGRLKKKYNYIFTGLNDQIINFDLNLNLSYAAAISRFDGAYLNGAMGDKGIQTHNHSREEVELNKKIRRITSLQNNAKTNDTSLSTEFNKARKAIGASTLDIGAKTQLTKLLQHNAPPDQFTGTFISDVDIYTQTSTDAYAKFLSRTKDKLRPTVFAEAVQDNQAGNGIESNSNSGVQKVSSVFSRALNTGLDASLQKIRMTIKGDPYWLFPQPYTKGIEHQIFNSKKSDDEAINNIKNGYFNQSDAVNIYGGDSFLIVRLRTPRVFNTNANTEDGSDAFNEVETFSGVYKVTRVTSKFEMGKFTQELECILDPEIRLLDFPDVVNEPIKKINSQDLSNGRNMFPVTAEKSPRIADAGNISNINTQPRDLIAEQIAITRAARSARLPISNIPVLTPSPLPGLPNSFK